MTDETLRCPIGKFIVPEAYTDELMAQWKKDIKALPALMREAVKDLSDEQLETPYRPGGWTIRQVVHHVADSHINSIIRFKWTMTEDNPTIKAYHEDRWAKLADYKLPIEPSLIMLEGIHARLTALFESFTADDWNRTFFHPEMNVTLPLRRVLGIYAWHGKHHLAHIAQAKRSFKA
ncbi:YfiT family bacillithiol transferase [Mucilaginibacter calamicampi]|uniref:YfiT family bacillithiol transferase n=1 Tax=Mucilaginibacter calamicampi TaxID=1302352 RepID=A0ABW2YU08_9SPHI